MADFKIIGEVPAEYDFFSVDPNSGALSPKKALPVGFEAGNRLCDFMAVCPCGYCGSNCIIPVYESESGATISFETWCCDCIYREVPQGYKKYTPEGGESEENGLCPSESSES